MRVWVLLVLLSVVPGSYSKFLELRVDVDFPGDDIQQIFSPDAYHCQLACTEHSSCLFFTFLRSDWVLDNRNFHCYLKYTANGIPSRVSDLKGVTSGFSLSRLEYKTRPCLSSTYQDTNFPGLDYHEFPSSSSDKCQNACTNDPYCRFFSFTTESFSVADRRWPFPVPPVITTKNVHVSGFSQSLLKANGTFKQECSDLVLANINFPGNDLEQIVAGSPQHCQILCTIHPRCNHFSYTRPQMRCYLKYKPSGYEPVRGDEVYSGFPACNCRPSNVSRFENVDLTGADYRFVVTTDPESCQNICTADPDCQFYTYIFPSNPEPIHRNRCYLKRVMTLPRPSTVVTTRGVVSGFSLKDCQDN
ncbi:coagulation factor XI-like [Colossoma macropomum]|uniref:coagulation factor XI-like n=1 Tax=Colossoma macropomum TaxID=42526 RepID=UPI001863F65A|nr:coagulation factor XI-like [Colossoma macropomum]